MAKNKIMYQNIECGNILTYDEMLEEFAELYDGGDPTNPTHWSEKYTPIPNPFA